MANIKVSAQGGNNVNVEVTPVAKQTIEINRGVAGVGIESISIYYDGTTYYLDFLYTDGTNELVPLPETVTGVTSFNTRVGAVTLTLADVTTALGYTPPTPTGGGASGTWAISVSGNAATVTNGVVTTGTYSDPLWITALAASKITGTLTNSQLANSSITINGTPVSLGGSVTTGTVTSVAATAGTGISVSGSPITSSGTFNIVNTAPDQIVSLTGAGTTTVTGTYPNFTITSSGGGGDVTGAASSTDNAITRFDGTTGKAIQNSTVTLDDTGNFANTNSVQFDTTPTVPTATGAMYWDEGNGTPSINLNADVTLQLGQEIVTMVYNGTGSTITNGSVVAVAGAQGQRPSVVLADADSESTSASTLGIATQNIANGTEGFITSFGFVRGVNTSGFTAGAPIYLSQTAGQFTATRPSAPAHTVILGWVIKVNASSGEIFVHINNGWELDELHNVLITSPTSGNTLIYDASVGVWKNANLTDGTGISITEGAGSITVANTGVLGVTATSPVASSGGQNPVISMPAATTSVSGYLTSTDWNTFNGKYSVGGALGTPSSGTLTNCTSLPIGGISATGTPSSTTYLRGDGTWSTVSGGSGTVTSVDLTMPSGFSVLGNPITSSGTLAVSTSLSGIVKGNGTGFTTATSGTDYAPATSGNSILYGNGSGGFSNVTIGTNLTFTGGTLSASGGGGSSLLYYKESTTIPTTPVASGTYSIAMGNSATAIESSSTGNGAVSINGYSSGNESFSAAINRNLSFQTNFGALGNQSIAIGKYATAQNYRSIAMGYSSTASADGSVCIGIEGRTWGVESVALGRSVASGVSSFSAITSDISGNYGSLDADTIAIGYHAKANYGPGVAIGYGATATGYRGIAIGHISQALSDDSVAIGDGAVVYSGYYHSIALGSSAASSGDANITIGYGSASAGQSAIAIGEQAYANINYGVSIGYYAQNDQTINKYTYGTKVCDSFGGGARAQAGKLILGVATTDNTPTALSSDINAATYNNQLNFTTSYQAIAFTGLVVCRQDAASGSDSSAWKIEGLIRREAGVGTEVLVASSVTAISNASGYTVALSADTTNGCLAVTVTGGATTNLHWIATIDTAEVSYE